MNIEQETDILQNIQKNNIANTQEFNKKGSENKANAKAIVSFFLGILSLIFSFSPLHHITFGVGAILFSVYSKNNKIYSLLGYIGLSLGIVAIVFQIPFIISSIMLYF